MMAETQTEEPLIRAWTRASEQVFEKLIQTKPQLQWVRQTQAGLPESLASLEWWEAEYDAAGSQAIWIGLPAPQAVEIGRLAQAVAGAQGQGTIAESFQASDTVRLLCESFGTLLSAESSGSVRYRSLKRLDSAPEPEIIYSGAITLAPGSIAQFLLGFKTATSAIFQQLTGRPGPAGVDPELADNTPLGLLLDLELPLSIRFGRVQMPLERVLELQPGSLLELDGSQDDQVDLLVNGSVVARGEVVAVEGQYGVRILEILNRDGKIQAARPLERSREV